MFSTPKKHQYAIRAIFELAKHRGAGPIKISDIARAQAIPRRFLEVILNQIKGSGLLQSKRGFTGGYALVRPPSEISVGDVFRFMRGDRPSLFCVAGAGEKHCKLYETCALAPFWQRVQDAVYTVYEDTTIQDLLDNESSQP